MTLGRYTGAVSVGGLELTGHWRLLGAEPAPRVTVEQIGDGMLRIDLQPQSHITKTDGELARTRVLALAAGKPVCVLLDITGVGSVSREAVTFYSEASHVAAFALLGGTAVDKVIAHGLRGLAWPACPVRYFLDEGEALAWLKGYC